MEKKEKKKFKIPIRKELITSVLMMVIMFAVMFAFMPLVGMNNCDDSRYEHYAYIIVTKMTIRCILKRTRYSFLLFKCL